MPPSPSGLHSPKQPRPQGGHRLERTAAGATDVVGTLTPIADTDARELFLSIHRHLTAGDVPAEAVRAAQREAIARHSDAWRAVASLTRCINRNEKRS